MTYAGFIRQRQKKNPKTFFSRDYIKSWRSLAQLMLLLTQVHSSLTASLYLRLFCVHDTQELIMRHWLMDSIKPTVQSSFFCV